MEILRRTDSPHIVNSHGIQETPSSNMKILMEYMDLGTLESLLKTKGRDFFTEERLAGIGRQVLAGLNYLHSHKIIHRDINPESYTGALHGPFPVFATWVEAELVEFDVRDLFQGGAAVTRGGVGGVQGFY
ncbi:Mitogen-activated protein kinase kinase 9 [Linum perenne]